MYVIFIFIYIYIIFIFLNVYLTIDRKNHILKIFSDFKNPQNYYILNATLYYKFILNIFKI